MILIDYLIPALFGDFYKSSILLSKVTLLTAMFIVCNSIISEYLISAQRTYTITLVYSLGVPLKFFIAVYLIPKFFSIGLGIAECFHAAFCCVMFLYFSFNKSNKKVKSNVLKFFFVFISSTVLIELVQFLNITLPFLVLIKLIILMMSFFVFYKYVISDLEHNFFIYFYKNFIKKNLLKFFKF